MKALLTLPCIVCFALTARTRTTTTTTLSLLSLLSVALVLAPTLATHGSYEFVKPKEVMEAKRSTNYGLVKNRNPPQPLVRSPLPSSYTKKQDLPTHFDWRNVDGVNYITASVNQHIPKYCGSCWIHGTAAAINDRIKVMRKGAFPDVQVSRQNLVNCVPVDDSEGTGETGGCMGGDPKNILSWMTQNKVPDETCQTYVAENMECKPYNVCHNCEPDHGTCFPIYYGYYTGYGIDEWGNVSGAEEMMAEIFSRGPIVCSIAAVPDFDDGYPANIAKHEGIYINSTDLSDDEVNHNVEILGWGETQSGTKYWIGRNSWGTYWGEGGFFRIGRGDGKAKNLRIEADCQWMIPEWEDLDEMLDGDFSGDYNHGLLPTEDGKRYSNRPVPSHKKEGEKAQVVELA